MTLSIKAALLVSFGFIGGMSWLLHAYGMETAEAPSVLNFPQREAGPALAERPILVFSETPGDWERRFGHPSALELEVTQNRWKAEQLAIVRATLPVQAATLPMQQTPQPQAVTAPAAAAVSVETAAETSVRFAAAVAPVAPAAAGAKRYVVQRGDSLNRLARRFASERGAVESYVRLLLEANPAVQKRGGLILAGEELLIPDCTAASSRMAERAGGRDVDSRDMDSRDVASPPSRDGLLRLQPTAAAVQAAAPGAAPSSTTASSATPSGKPPSSKPAAEEWYVIQPNDTLARIAARYLNDQTRWREIVAHNQGLQANRVVPGMRIKLPPVRLAQR